MVLLRVFKPLRGSLNSRFPIANIVSSTANDLYNGGKTTKAIEENTNKRQIQVFSLIHNQSS